MPTLTDSNLTYNQSTGLYSDPSGNTYKQTGYYDGTVWMATGWQKVSDASSTTNNSSSSTTSSSSNQSTQSSDLSQGLKTGDIKYIESKQQSILNDPKNQLSNYVPKYSDEQIAAGTMEQQDAMKDLQADVKTVGSTETADEVTAKPAQTYEAAKSFQDVTQNEMTAAQRELIDKAVIDPSQLQIDIEGTAQGNNAVGQALKESAQLNIEDVDPKATLTGQMALLQSQFVDANGNATIPAWASGIARSVSKIAAFKGITGTAATEAMTNALLEGTIQIAQQDAKFFQTLTLQNLSNEQQQVINRASVLANMDISNLDTRTTVAVQNSKAFLEMDLKNLDNDQQARIVNTQARIQSLLEDAKSENVSRQFGAASENDMAKFYDQLGSAIQQFNAAQINGMNQFNVGEENTMGRFNTQLEDSRDKFYRQMQYQIDYANAQWRQTIATKENQWKFEAAAVDVQNRVNINQEYLNQLWDRANSLFDYAWKTSENEKDRNAAYVVAKLQSDTSKSIATTQSEAQKAAAKSNQYGTKDIIGSIIGALVGKLFGS